MIGFAAPQLRLLRVFGSLLALATLALMAYAHWHWNRQTAAHAALLQESVGSARDGLNQVLAHYRVLGHLFAQDQLGLITATARAPTDPAAYRALADKVAAYFPGHLAFTVTDNTGVPLLPESGKGIGPQCRQQLSETALEAFSGALPSGSVLSPLLHTGQPDAHHFDLISTWRDLTGEGLFFVSIRTTELEKTLRQHERHGTRLRLMAGADGVDPQAALVNEPLADTRWRIVGELDPQVESANRKAFLLESVVAWGVVALTLALLYWISLQEKRLLDRTQAINQQLRREKDERRHAEDALHESEDRYRLLFETMEQGVVYQDATGRIISANPAAQRILGRDLEQLRHMSFLDDDWRTLHPDGSTFPGQDHPAMVALRTGKPIHNVAMGVYNPVDEEYRWVNVNAKPGFLPGADTPHQVYATLEDISERKRAADALLRQRVILEETVASRTADLVAAKLAAERANQAKSAFLANISHELKTPLHGVLGFAAAASKALGKGQPDKAEHYLANILSSGQRLQDLVTDLLALSSLESGKMRFRFLRTDLALVVHHCIGEQETRLRERDLTVDLQTYTHDTGLDGDAGRLAQVVANLLANAIRFSPPGGCIRILLMDENNAPGNSLVRMEILDQGPGVPVEEHQIIFEKFTQGHRHGTVGGTGLGLAICREIVQAHGGDIHVEDNPAGGARFIVRLPRRRPPNHEPSGETPP